MEQLACGEAILVGITAGLFGGLIGGIYDYVISINKQFSGDQLEQKSYINRLKLYKSKYYWIGRAVIGLAGSFGIFAIVILISKLQFKLEFNASSENIILLIGIGIIAGTCSHKIIPSMGVKIQEALLGKRFEQVKAEITEEGTTTRTYSSGISTAETKLASDNTSDIQIAINNLEELKKKFPTDRTLNIYLGRLYRKIDDYDNAILSLREFIKQLDNIRDSGETPLKEVNKNIADANYNIACYHSLKAAKENADSGRAEEVERLVHEALEFLQLATRDHPENCIQAKEDKDFDFIRTEMEAICPEDE